MNLSVRAVSISLALLAGSCTPALPPFTQTFLPPQDNTTYAAKQFLYVSSFSNRGRITEYALDGKNPIRTLSKNVAGAHFIFDAKGNLYTTSVNQKTCQFASCVEVFPPGNVTPSRTIALPTGFTQVTGLALDASGNLFVCSGTPGSVSSAGLVNLVVYKAGTNKILRTITSGIASPETLAFDRHGNLYVANANQFNPGNKPNTIAVYAPPDDKLVRMITIPLQWGIPSRLAFDRSENLYVASNPLQNDKPGRVAMYAAGSSQLKLALVPRYANVHAQDVAVDRAGRIYVSWVSIVSGLVGVYAAGSTKRLYTIGNGYSSSSSGYPQSIALDDVNRLYVGWSTGSASGFVDAYAPGSSKLVRAFRSGIANVVHVALGP